MLSTGFDLFFKQRITPWKVRVQFFCIWYTAGEQNSVCDLMNCSHTPGTSKNIAVLCGHKYLNVVISYSKVLQLAQVMFLG